MEMAKTYKPDSFEKRIYEDWIKNGYFTAKTDNDKIPFTIVIPPPNITGQLHMGHALNNSIQDAIIRFKRMQGYSALYLPGTDHASIATEVKIIQQMALEGLTKADIGREAFLERAWKWKEKYGGKIIEQLKSLGCSCDWTRLAFTMDEKCNKAVKEVFVNLYNKGLIYQGSRIINWCPCCKTAISDAEVDYSEQDSYLWHIKYMVKGSDEFIIVATTRPETMLGDTAVAVNPDDARYKNMVGKMLVLPLTEREIPVISDSYVDKDFGTGAVKITPAHDPNDFEVGLRHNLEVIRVMSDDGSMNEKAGNYSGLNRFMARAKIIEDLKALNLLIKIQPHKHNIGKCYRCGEIVEPIVSKQWFVKMKPLAEPAIEEVKNKNIKFIPKKFEKIYFNWMENIKDWCISRQLWWGHRIPAYYCAGCGKTIVSVQDVKVCPYCGDSHIKQDEDVLDTWFSSALWPFSTLGFPDETEDLKYFYPTDVLVTAYDIIFFWVARMIFSGIEHMHKIPFKDVLITGLVRDSQGRKMSKSLGNGIDPLEIINKYGADTLRFSLLSGISPGGDMRFSDEKVEGCRNFVNKLWNASRFVLMNAEGRSIKDITDCKFSLADKWILTRLNHLIKDVTLNMEKYELGLAGAKLYDFVWSEFCDWYIEMAKPVLYGDDDLKREYTLSVLVYVLDTTLKLIHPFIPFVTEEIYQNLPGHCGSIMTRKFPCYNKKQVYPKDSANMKIIMELIKAVRNLRVDMNVQPYRRTKIMIVPTADKKIFESAKLYIEKLGYATTVEMLNKEQIKGDNISIVLPSCEVYIASEELIDFEKEKARLSSEYKTAESELARAEGKLVNSGFTSKAPKSLIEAEQQKVDKFKKLLQQITERLEKLK